MKSEHKIVNKLSGEFLFDSEIKKDLYILKNLLFCIFKKKLQKKGIISSNNDDILSKENDITQVLLSMGLEKQLITLSEYKYIKDLFKKPEIFELSYEFSVLLKAILEKIKQRNKKNIVTRRSNSLWIYKRCCHNKISFFLSIFIIYCNHKLYIKDK